MMAGPIVLTSANRSGQPDAVTAEEVSARWAIRCNWCSTTAKAAWASLRRWSGGPERSEVLRQGVVSEQTLAAAVEHDDLVRLHRQHLPQPDGRDHVPANAGRADGLRADGAGRQGVVVMSAGISAMMGGRPRPEAVDVMGQMGLNLADHESQPLTAQLVRQADVIWTMTRSHRQAIVSQWPEAAGRTTRALSATSGHGRSDRRAGRVLRALRRPDQGAQLAERIATAGPVTITDTPGLFAPWRARTCALPSEATIAVFKSSSRCIELVRAAGSRGDRRRPGRATPASTIPTSPPWSASKVSEEKSTGAS